MIFMSVQFKKISLLNILILLFWIIYLPPNSIGQQSELELKDDVKEKRAVHWIGQFSSSKDLEKSSQFSHRLFNFVFGTGEKKLVRPISLAAFAEKQWIILDQGNKNLVYVDQNEGKFQSLGKSAFPSPVGICMVSKDSIYFTDSYLNKIFYGKISDKKFQDLNQSLMLERPTGIAYAALRDEIWVVETTAHQITILNRDGEVLRRYGRRGTAPGEFNFPTFIWIDRWGKVYIVDSMNFRIQILNLDGDVLFSFGEAGDATGYFARPKGIATDSQDNIYVVDALFHTVQIFNQEGQFLSNFGEQGREPGQFWLPAGIYIDDQDRIYVADSYNSRIQVFQLVPGEMDEN